CFLSISGDLEPRGRSEVELGDVFLGEDEGWAEEDFVAVDLDIAEASRLEGGVAGLEGAFGEGLGGVDGEVAEVDGVPEGELADGAVLDVLAHALGGREAGEEDPVGHAGVAQ